ncbi:hypothetical protein [Parapedobacter tibetensis]|uniref:hypothetical protein n=1 Tax=Parapedobacter tibetensis TaxID=2972951 RepID=UPI00214D7A4E|nr:hypothetical protein [Parapedobacter tibetensis]
MTFKKAVVATPVVETCYQTGLKALGNNSGKINLGDTTKCDGSVDIDGCTVTRYSNSNRRDYCFSYKSCILRTRPRSAQYSENCNG